MILLLIRWLILTIAVAAAAWLVPGVTLKNDFWGFLWVAIIFGLVNAIVRPILMLMTCPLIILTLGLFMVIVNTMLFSLTAWLTNSLEVTSFWSALFASIVVSIVSMVLNIFVNDDNGGD